MASTKSFDKTLKRLCNKKITAPDEELLGESFTVSQAIAAAVIKKAMSGATDAVKLIREIVDDEPVATAGEFKVDINVIS